ncbi:hypothetical protein [Pseudomonas sp. UBA6562]|uniref:hypothetical protein n=1 Tax=Pseudomonas sp. UBA6562 TaxID=1947332 RepID=UPI0025CF20B7|nr:hypothetical protein [Pseudomonas sp. UBA6562]
MKTILKFALTAAVILPMAAYADNPILVSLKAKEKTLTVLDNAKLEEIKGAALLIGQPLPSVTMGLRTYQVTWKKRGSTADFRSYQRIGYDYDPHRKLTFNENGVEHKVAGDRWLADQISNVGSWSLANSFEIDRHFQALDPNTGTPLNFGWRNSAWNRPTSTFSW